MQIPEAWPPAVAEEYIPVRALGHGGFASVVLAHHKQNVDHLVAMKVVMHSSSSTAHQHHQQRGDPGTEAGYAHREVDILSALSHPHMMRLLQHWETDNVTVMALSYAPGPTLLNLLRVNGCLSFSFTRIIMAQLVDVVLYLHSHAVVHRDIKPDNIIVTGAALHQEDIWEDASQRSGGKGTGGTSGKKAAGANNNNNINIAASCSSSSTFNSADWQRVAKRWHVTLVDFGFARALSPNDLKAKQSQLLSSSAAASPRTDDLDASCQRVHHRSSNPQPVISAKEKDKDDDCSSERSLSRSRRLVRKMSALGNRAFAAPEIITAIQFLDDPSGRANQQHPVVDATKTLSHHVSYYGLQVDAYAVGNVMKYCLTGVPPNENVNEVLELEHNPIIVAVRWLCTACSRIPSPRNHDFDDDGNNNNDLLDVDSSSSSSNHDRKCRRRRRRHSQQAHRRRYGRPHYRRWSEIPTEPMRLLKGLLHTDPQKRTTLRMARQYPYIDSVLSCLGQETPSMTQAIDYLPMVRAQTTNPTTVDTPKISTTNNTSTTTKTAPSAPLPETAPQLIDQQHPPVSKFHEPTRSSWALSEPDQQHSQQQQQQVVWNHRQSYTEITEDNTMSSTLDGGAVDWYLGGDILRSSDSHSNTSMNNDFVDIHQANPGVRIMP